MNVNGAVFSTFLSYAIQYPRHCTVLAKYSRLLESVASSPMYNCAVQIMLNTNFMSMFAPLPDLRNYISDSSAKTTQAANENKVMSKCNSFLVNSPLYL